MNEYEDIKERARIFWRKRSPTVAVLDEDLREEYVSAMLVEFAAEETKLVLEKLV